MITQNPIIGKARKKIGKIYARTLYGMNILQSCPPSTKGRQTEAQVASSNAFGIISRMSNQISASLLLQLFYQAPVGRSRRAVWCHQLYAGMVKTPNGWEFDPSLLMQLGGNAVVSTAPLVVTPVSDRFTIAVSALSATPAAILTEKPCLILVNASSLQCVSLYDFTELSGETLHISNLSSTLINQECYIYPLWCVNVGTRSNPIVTFGSFQLSNQ